MPILDHNGQPISTAQLKTAQATATPWGVRKATSQVSLTGLDPARLAHLLRSAEHMDSRPYLELAEEMEEKYLHYAAQLATRKRAVVALEWSVDPASDKLRDKKIAEFVAKSLPAIKAATFDMLDCIGKGFSVSELLWDTSGGEWKISGVERRDPRWFQHDRIDGKTLRMRSDTNPDGDPLTPGKFLVINASGKSGLPIRGGLARAAAYAYLFHNFSLRDWVTFCEMFGIPLRLGRYEAGVASTDDLSVLYQAVHDLGTDSAAMLPKNMEIEFPTVGAGRVGADLWENLLDYLDRQVSKLVLGQTLTADTGKGGGGSYALGSVHNDVRIDILRADATALASAVNTQLVKLLVDLNFGGADYPTLRLPVDDPEDLVAMATIVGKAVEMGQPVSQQWFSDKFCIPLPKPGEAILGKPMSAPVADPALAPAAQRAAHSKIAADPDTADKMVPALASAGQVHIEALVAQIGEMLDKAESLESFRNDLLTRYADLPADELVTVMAQALAAIELRGRAEVLSGQ